MTTKTRIETLGLGDKVIAYHLQGLSLRQICARMETEHNQSFTAPTIDRYLKKHKPDLDKTHDKALLNRVNWTLDEVRSQLADTIDEIRGYIEEHKDDPRAVGTFLKVRLDALDKIAKLLGGYPGDHPTVNVQVNNIVSKEAFEKSLKDSEEYFESLERVGGEHAV